MGIAGDKDNTVIFGRLLITTKMPFSSHSEFLEMKQFIGNLSDEAAKNTQDAEMIAKRLAKYVMALVACCDTIEIDDKLGECTAMELKEGIPEDVWGAVTRIEAQKL